MKKRKTRWTWAAALLAAVLYLGQAANLGAAERTFIFRDTSPADIDGAIAAAAGWLVETHQNDDGGYSAFSAGANIAPSDAGGTVDALLALGPAGEDLAAPLSYLIENALLTEQYAGLDGSTAGKLVIALSAAGEDPTNFAGQNFVITLSGHLSPTGQFGVDTAFNQSLAMLGLVTADEPVPEQAISWLIDLQENEGDLAGSWDDGFGTPGNVDSTAMALMALSLSRSVEATEAIAASVDFLSRSQLASGGWEYGPGFGENANSTALALQALNMVGEDVVSVESPWNKSAANPLTALLSWQGESGAFQADFGEGRFDDFYSTVQALPALASLGESQMTIYAPALAADQSSETVSEGESAYPVESPPDGSDQIDEETAASDEDVAEDESSGGLSSLCSSAFALTFIAGAVLVVPARRRR